MGSVSTTLDRIYNLRCNKVVQAVIKEDSPHCNKVVQGGIREDRLHRNKVVKAVNREDRLHHSKRVQAVSKGDILVIWVISIYIILTGSPLALNTNIPEVGTITGMICGNLKEGK